MFLTAVLCSLFQSFFTDATIRADYIFSGDDRSTVIALSGLVGTEGWYGRRVNMDSLPVRGNGDVVMRDAGSGTVIYETSFSSLYIEWLTTEEAGRVRKSFQHSVLLPAPKASADVEIRLFGRRGEVTAEHSFRLDPDDILIRRAQADSDVVWNYVWKGGDSRKCIDVVIMAEGYGKEEMPLFRSDAAVAAAAILAAEPFASLKNRLNLIAVESVSLDSGVSEPGQGIWKRTAVSSHFNTFYSDRYLTTQNVFDIHGILSGIPYEHIIILANTDTYGGGGIYNSYTLTAAHHPAFKPVVVHEFGHSFGALADEYFYEHDDVLDASYDISVEPWEQNITSLVDFGSKWADMLPADAAVPGIALEQAPQRYETVGVYEGGGYLVKGMYRPVNECRMRTNSAPGFCPVCRRAIARMIRFYTVQR